MLNISTAMNNLEQSMYNFANREGKESGGERKEEGESTRVN